MGEMNDGPLRFESLEDLDRRTRELLAESFKTRICPECHQMIPEGEGVGTGQISDGWFCSLSCFAIFRRDLLEQPRRTDLPPNN